MPFGLTEKKITLWIKQKKITKIIKALKKNELCTINLLKKIDEPAIIPLINFLKMGDKGTNEVIKKTLSKIGSQVLNPIQQILNKYDTNTKKHIADILGEINEKSSIHILISLLKDKSPLVCQQAILNLKKLDAKEAIEPVIELINSKNESMRKKVVSFLDSMGKMDKEIVKAFLGLINDANHSIRIKAINYLGNFGNNSVVEPLIHILEKQLKKNEISEDIFYATMNSLVKLKDARAIKSLISALEILSDWEPTIKDKIAQAIVTFGDPAVKNLITKIKSKKIEGARCIFWALGQLKNDKSIEPLLKAAKSNDDNIRCEAAKALHNMCNKQIVDVFIHRLNNKDYRIRQYAAEVLGLLGDDRAIEPLEKALRDSSNKESWDLDYASDERYNYKNVYSHIEKALKRLKGEYIRV